MNEAVLSWLILTKFNHNNYNYLHADNYVIYFIHCQITMFQVKTLRELPVSVVLLDAGLASTLSWLLPSRGRWRTDNYSKVKTCRNYPLSLCAFLHVFYSSLALSLEPVRKRASNHNRYTYTDYCNFIILIFSTLQRRTAQ